MNNAIGEAENLGCTPKKFSDGLRVMRRIIDDRLGLREGAPSSYIGRRCQVSEQGIDEGVESSYVRRNGEVVGESRDKTCWLVRWDGNSLKSRTAYHKDFIQIL